MINLRWVASLACLSILSVSAQIYRFGPPPDWVDLLNIDGLAISDTSCTSGGEEFLLQDRQSHLGRDEFCFRLVTRLTSSEGVQNGSQVSIRIDPSYQRLVIHHIAVIRDGAVILHATPSSVRVLQQEPDLAMHLYDENRTIVVDLPGVRKGDLIDQLYTTKGENPAHQGRFSAHYQMGYGVPIGRDRVRLVIPTDRSVDYREHDVAGLRKVLSLAGAEEWMWDRAQVPCTRSEDRTPGWHRTFPSLEVSEFGTLEDLRQWAIGLYDIDRSLSGQLADVVRELKSVRDPLARIDSAVHLVQREVRYLGLEDGISAYRPHPPAQVLHQRFGDCKDQSLLLVTLLNAIGVEAWPALVNTNEGRRLPQSLPRPGLFDHCVVLLRHAGQEYWIDPTRTHGMGSLKERTVPDFAYGLVLDEKRSGWSALPYLRRGAVELEERFTLDSIGGGAILDVLTVYRGQQADMQRAHLAGNSLAQVGKSYLDFYSRQYGGATALGPIKVTDDPTANILKVAERYSLMDLWEGPDSTGVYVLNAEATYLRDVVFTSNVRFRATPIALSYPFEVRQRIILKMPEPWSVEIQPKEINGFGIQYTQATRAFADTVLAEFYYSSDSLSVAAEDSPAFHDQQEQIMDDLGFVLTYGGEVDGLIVRQRWAIAAILLFVALAIWGAIVLYRFDPPGKADALGMPTTAIGGWMVLPAIGLILSPFRVMFDLLSDWPDFIYSPVYASYVAVEDPSLYQLYCYFSQAMNIGVLTVCILANLLFWSRRTSLPRIMVLFYAMNFLNLFIDLMAYDFFDLRAVTGEAYGAKDVVRAFIGAAIWIPYFLVSSRVHTTFRKRYDGSFDGQAPGQI